MGNWSSIHAKILEIVNDAQERDRIIIETIFSHIGKTIGMRDMDACKEGGDLDEVTEILAVIDKKGLCVGVYEKDKLCSMPITLDAERMNCVSRRMIEEGARIVEI